MQNYPTQNFLSRGFSEFSASLFLALTLAVLAGCGSGGSGGTPIDPNAAAATAATPVIPAPADTPAASIQLLVSSPQMPSSGVSTVDLTAIVLSAAKQAVSGRTVTFTIVDAPAGAAPETAFTNNFGTTGLVSDANGIVTAKLNLGTNKANRTIALTATADAATATNSVDVTGTTATISGSSSLAFNNATTLTFTVKDSAGTALPGVTVDVASQTGNGIVRTPVSGITNSSGQITAVATATQPGNDTITATAAGASATQALTISSASFAFTTPAANAEIPLTGTGSTPTVTVNWTDAATPPVGPVSFSTSRGTIAGGTVTSNTSALVAGNASVSVSSATAGPAIITASSQTGTPAATLNVIFVATSASSVTAQAVPGTIQVTNGSASQVTNSSTISALVRDANNNLVKNASVSFTITSDPTGGRLTSSTGITDVSGIVSVTYIAGSISSGQITTGVAISTTVDKIGTNAIAPITSSTTLTVAGQSLEVRLGTDNLVGSTAPINTKTYVAIVSDAAGNAVVNTTVRFALRPDSYAKGFYTFDDTAAAWLQTITAVCPNEDRNFNGILDVPPTVPVGEDDPNFSGNGNGSLDPGNVATVNATATTDATGIATATITYPKDHATWVADILEARTGVVGNDPPALVTFVLRGLASDYTDKVAPPPGVVSPYGQSLVCNDTN